MKTYFITVEFPIEAVSEDAARRYVSDALDVISAHNMGDVYQIKCVEVEEAEDDNPDYDDNGNLRAGVDHK